MPLLFVLDTETGIGYPDNVGQMISPLADNVPTPSGKSNNIVFKWNETQEWLFAKLLDATNNKLTILEITDEDIKGLKSEWKDLPPSLSILFSMVSERTVHLESISGSSAANLLGRFACGNSAIKEIVCNITNQEKQKNETIVFAEIVHLPEARTGNVLLHPPFREYEIPYLAQSSLQNEQKIMMGDLYIKVVANKVMLLSKKLNKEIIPRLSNAHNYITLSLPVYHFLCDLQTQQFRSGFSFNWGVLSNQFNFLPRVQYKNVILFEATWQLKKDDFIVMQSATIDYLITANEFQQKNKLPQYCVLVDGDNELLIDFNNEFSIRAFVKALKNRKTIILKEFLHTNTTIKSAEGKCYANQFIASIINTNSVYNNNLSFEFTDTNTPSEYIPGTEWLYFKIYCGIKTSDTILQNAIKPISDKLMATGKITEWFFIRYSDPNNHLRFRMKVSSNTDWNCIINEIQQFFSDFQINGSTWKIQIDTYNQEVQRYGSNSTHLAEKLFCIDSVAKLDFLEITEGDERDEIRWLWGMRQIDEMLNCFGLSLDDKIQVFATLKDAFSKEFNIDKNAKNAINKVFNEARGKLNQFLLPFENADTQANFLVLNCIKKFKQNCTPIAKELLQLKQNNLLQVEWNTLLSSYIHMSCNRLFPANARKNEMILYTMLSRYYSSQKAICIKQNLTTKHIVSIC